MRIERQLTIDELAERLALSRSTIYYWVRDLPDATQVEQQSVDGPNVAL
jgi:predicted transcriptional regulator